MDVKVYSLAADGDKYLTPHFQVKEFRCRDGSDVVLIHEQLPWDLEAIRYQASQEHGMASPAILPVPDPFGERLKPGFPRKKRLVAGKG